MIEDPDILNLDIGLTATDKWPQRMNPNRVGVQKMVQFRVGLINVVENKLIPVPSKGVLIVQKESDQILVCWTSRESGGLEPVSKNIAACISLIINF